METSRRAPFARFNGGDLVSCHVCSKQHSNWVDLVAHQHEGSSKPPPSFGADVGFAEHQGTRKSICTHKLDHWCSFHLLGPSSGGLVNTQETTDARHDCNIRRPERVWNLFTYLFIFLLFYFNPPRMRTSCLPGTSSMRYQCLKSTP